MPIEELVFRLCQGCNRVVDKNGNYIMQYEDFVGLKKVGMARNVTLYPTILSLSCARKTDPPYKLTESVRESCEDIK